ncbi:hypothetical protein T265_07896 [Opisthorchis viverrini]|uniref:Uncharacterized protein n=1 Tax=Opisthorchis viverrini TaxID=6198 RepID=A0A075AA32_OPIVI|nr:hypothetical protein T265_07896 [Opisthorchis viverrini]KER24419.1 hypothetical protein T265_07896 [Opisthorchis viverrini]
MIRKLDSINSAAVTFVPRIHRSKLPGFRSPESEKYSEEVEAMAWPRLILCRVSLPGVDSYKDCPWDAIQEATVVDKNGEWPQPFEDGDVRTYLEVFKDPMLKMWHA